MKTKWTCKSCGKSGMVEHAEDADYYDVVPLIFTAHRKANPDCLWDPDRVKVEIMK